MLKTSNDASNLYQARGTGEEHFKYFIENRLNYCDSKWYASDYADDYIALRVYTPATWAGVEPSPNITVTPFSNMYAGVRYKANGALLHQRAEKNIPITFEPPSGTDLNYNEDFSDTESAIYGASQLSSVGDLAPLYCGTLNVSKATKLVELKVGDGTEGYVNDHLHSLSVGTNKLLKKIDVQNCPKLTDALNLSGCPNVEEIYAKGSGISSVALGDSGFVRIMQLPNTIVSLALKNQTYIEELTLEGYDSVKTLRIENCPTIDSLEILENCANVERVRLTNVDWEFDDASFLLTLSERGLKGIDENGINTDTMWIDGKCHITSLSGAEMARLNGLYPYLTITYTNLTTQLIFMSEDGQTELARQTINNGGNGTDPVTAGAISKPTKTSTAQYNYTFAGWSKTAGGSATATALTKVTADRYVYVAFTATVRTYTVYFYNGSTLLETVYDVPYGDSVTYSGATPVKNGVEVPEDYEFTGWSPEPKGITGTTQCYAQYRYTGYLTPKLIDRSISGDYVNDRVTTIGDSAFNSCTALTSVSFPNVISISRDVFDDCYALTNVDFPKLTTIGRSAFSGCKALTSVYFPNVTSIDEYAFQTCTTLTSVDFPKLTTIGEYAFSSCKALTRLTNVDFPKLTTIGKYAFQGCNVLTSVSLSNVTTIGERAFQMCGSLTNVDFPNVTSIGEYAFSSCKALTSVDLSNVTTINSGAFKTCSALTTLIIRSTEQCYLKSSDALSATPIKTGTGYIYVPAALVDQYKAAYSWSTYASQIRAIEDYPEICGGDV